MITINLFCYFEMVFIVMNILMTGKNLMKHHYLKKEDFYSHLNMEDITDVDYTLVKGVCKDLER